jgi:APA family basic amino acid/polyamine antiporter
MALWLHARAGAGIHGRTFFAWDAAPLTTSPPAPDRPSLSVWDAVSLIVGIVIGSSIYESPPRIFGNVSSPAFGLGLWIVGGGLSLLGALVYAELATTYPRCGGEYNYLTRAYGPWLGFLFAWAQLSVIQTGSIGALAYIAAKSAAVLCGWPETSQPWFAAGAVVVLTATNMAGLRLGAGLQNVLTVVKLVGLTAVIGVGLLFGTADPLAASPPSADAAWPLALIFVLYAYGGWNDAAFVAAEVRDLRRNLPRALVGGLGAIVGIYLLINLAYLRGLGGDGLRASSQPAADVLALCLGPRGAQAMHWLVLISALGGVNGLVFAVSRLHATVGQDHQLFAWLGGFSRGEAPVASLAVQAAVTVGIILSVGTEQGRQMLDQLVTTVGFAKIPWSQFYGGFDTLVAGSAPAFWLFFLLNAIGFFILRVRDRGIERPFVTPGFPILPALFAAMCAWMLYSAARYAWPLIPVMSAPLLLGLPLYTLSRWTLSGRAGGRQSPR